jgi:hypothetical protein
MGGAPGPGYASNSNKPSPVEVDATAQSEPGVAAFICISTPRDGYKMSAARS